MIRLLGVMALIVVSTAAHATMYKCVDGAGRTVYSDQPCNNNPSASQWKPKQPLNVVSSESLTGRKAEPADKRPAWLKPIDPVGDCKKKGGKIDPELRACMLP